HGGAPVGANRRSAPRPSGGGGKERIERICDRTSPRASLARERASQRWCRSGTGGNSPPEPATGRTTITCFFEGMCATTPSACPAAFITAAFRAYSSRSRLNCNPIFVSSVRRYCAIDTSAAETLTAANPEPAMQFTREQISEITVRQVEPGRIRIGNDVLHKNVMLTAEREVHDWSIDDIGQLDESSLT